MSEEISLPDYEAMSPQDLMNAVEKMSDTLVMTHETARVSMIFSNRMASFKGQDADRAKKLNTAIVQWSKELNDSYTLIQPTRSTEPKNLAAYIKKRDTRQ